MGPSGSRGRVTGDGGSGGGAGGWCIGPLLVRTEESLHQCSEGQQRVDGDTRAWSVPRRWRGDGACGRDEVGRCAWHGPVLSVGEEDDDMVDATGRVQTDEGEGLPHQRMTRVKNGDLMRRRIYW